MRNNRRDFILHLVLALACLVLAAAHSALAFYYGACVQRASFFAWAVIAVVASVWMFERMLVHCFAAVGREVDRQNKLRRHQEIMRDAMDGAFENALIQTNGKPHHRRKSA